jgi:cell division septum initiation protein DivIVA
MPEEYEIISIDPIRKLEEEVEELKQSIHSLREEIAIKTDNNIHTNNKPVHSPSANALIEYAKINQDIVNSLIKSNIEV